MKRRRPPFLAVALLVSLAHPRLADAGPDADATIAPEVLFLSLAAPSGSEVALAVGEHGQIYRRTAQSPAWARVDDDADGDVGVLLTAAACVDANHAWIAGHDATIVHSSDGGSTWEVQFSDPDAEAPVLDLWFEDATHGLAIGAFGLAYETFDGGATWESRDLDPEGPHLYGITETPSGSLLVAGEFGTVLRSTDRAATWERLELPYEGTFFGTLALTDGALLVFGLRGHLYRSEDDGATWVQVDLGTSASILAALERRDGSVLLVGLAGTILESRDRGRSFRRDEHPERLALTGLLELGDTVWMSSDQGIFPWKPSAPDPQAGREGSQ